MQTLALGTRRENGTGIVRKEKMRQDPRRPPRNLRVEKVEVFKRSS